MRVWDVYPAIDLRAGRVVRLQQGRPDRETVYGDDPLAVARRWQEAGTAWLHVVNLDAALGAPEQASRAAVQRIASAGLRVQLGGGLRSLEALRQAMDLGASRAVIGTAAVKDPAFMRAALEALGPDRLALAIDARQGQVQTEGWQQATPVTPIGLAGQWAGLGVRWMIVTDVSRDGMGTGLNLDLTLAVAAAAGPSGHVIASGGVDGLDDVRRAFRAGLSGVIVGRALYEGRIDLAEALRVGKEERHAG